MSRPLVVSPRAWEEAREQAAWIARDSRANAERFAAAVDQTFVSIAESPDAGRRFDTSTVALQSIRWRPVVGFRSHLVFYRASATEVVILRILHGSRDLPSVLLEP